MRDILRQYVTYKRNDGVTLSGTLYLPPGYKQGTRVPVIMWAYPREFGDADSASQVSGSPNSFTTIRGGSHMFLLLSGYAIFDNPTMPIIGPGETANDTYVEQLVASAQAAIDKVVEMGVADRDRIGVGGHSYGGFMTANLLAHSRLFRAGFAESGAYNRSLTPFGFQSERRTFWEVPDLYAKMSPFWYADKIKDPILLMHGEMDDNTGTFPINSERLYAALRDTAPRCGCVMLPNEAHGYAARETLLHVIAERLNWFDKYVKNAGARSTNDAQPLSHCRMAELQNCRKGRTEALWPFPFCNPAILPSCHCCCRRRRAAAGGYSSIASVADRHPPPGCATTSSTTTTIPRSTASICAPRRRTPNVVCARRRASPMPSR